MALLTKSLKSRSHDLSSAGRQIDILSDYTDLGIDSFEDKLEAIGLSPLKPTQIDILQINLGKMCNQTCKHCHVDAGPDRKEIMTRETMQNCLDAVDLANIQTVDLTGGAPEMNPEFRWFVEELHARGVHVMVRCNLTIIVANKKYHDLPQFYKANGVEVIPSLPYFAARRTDAQRVEGVFEKSIRALHMLNDVGYGREENLKLNLVYNPSGALLPASQESLEAEFKTRLKDGYGIDFGSLYCITNLPISRFLDFLLASGNYETYMHKLHDAFNPSAAMGVMCRNTISVGWDGYLYDCDFNQMLDMKVNGVSKHISEFDLKQLEKREIRVNQHCYGCTAGAGSSRGGEIA